MKPAAGASVRRVPAFSLEDALRAARGKLRILEIVAWVGGDRGRFADLIGFMTGGDDLLAARAAWAAGTCVETRPGFLRPHMIALLDRLDRPAVPPAVLRGTLRMLQFAPVAGDCEGRVLALAMTVLGGRVPVAAKVFAMTVLKRLAAGCPEILAEVRCLIDEQWHNASPAFRARARHEFGSGRSRQASRLSAESPDLAESRASICGR